MAFVVCDTMRMPGLPAAEMIDIDENGEILGLSYEENQGASAPFLLYETGSCCLRFVWVARSVLWLTSR